jgi:hypothetical protein
LDRPLLKSPPLLCCFFVGHQYAVSLLGLLIAKKWEIKHISQENGKYEQKCLFTLTLSFTLSNSLIFDTVVVASTFFATGLGEGAGDGLFRGG